MGTTIPAGAGCAGAGCGGGWTGYILTNLSRNLNWTLSWNLTCRDLSLILIYGTLSWVLNCGTLSLILYCRILCLICRTLYHIHKLILSIWISWIRGIWSIHPNLNISELFLTLSCLYFESMYIKIYILLNR